MLHERAVTAIDGDLNKSQLIKAYLTAWSKVFSFGNNAFVVVDVILPTVLGLIHVGKAGIKA